MAHEHSYTRSKPDATIETCHCGAFRHTEHSGPSIAAVETIYQLGQTRVMGYPRCELCGRLIGHDAAQTVIDVRPASDASYELVTVQFDCTSCGQGVSQFNVS